MSPRALLAAAGSDPGRERDNNEDRVLCDPGRGIYAVVDGVGGESGGEVAAQTAIEILHARLSRRTTEAGQLIREAIALANKKIYELSQGDPSLRGMACVMTVAVVDEGVATIGHVGDSRLYLIQAGAAGAPGSLGSIRKVTRDHSPVGMREDAGELSELEAMQHPRRNEIFRDVGSAPHEPDEEGFVDLTTLPFPADAALLLCSDGLSDLVTAGRIRVLVEEGAGDPERTVQQLIAEANANGGKDNVSLVVVEGERFAATVRGGGRKPAPASARPAVPPPSSRPAGERPKLIPTAQAFSVPSRRPVLLRLLGSRAAFLLYGAVLATVALSAFANPLTQYFGLDIGGRGGSGKLLRVGVGDGGLSTIREALDQARSGDTVEVAPGQYRETIRLKAGVELRSRTARAAILLPPLGSSEPVVEGEEVGGTRLVGFRIAGDARQSLTVGLRLISARVSVEGVEISGATGAALETAGDDRSEIRYSYLHDNPGTGIVVGGGAPDLRHNLILRNGRGSAGARPGVEVHEGATPQLADNRIDGNGGGGVVLPSSERSEEIFSWNLFGGASRPEAVRITGAPIPPAASAPAPATQAPVPSTPAARTVRPTSRPRRPATHPNS